MLTRTSQNRNSSEAVLDALNKSLAVIEFDTSGNILRANANFCSAVGYDETELVGKHHSMFVDNEHSRSVDYAEFWNKLASGNHDSGEYKRIANGGREIWIRATYNPVFNRKGQTTKVIKFATDITEEKLRAAEFQSKDEAVSRTQAVIEFDLNGVILTANNNFCDAIGYRLEEIQGKKHRMFVESEYGESAEYREFWNRLSNGEAVADEFKRIGKGGREVWIQASYNPILDSSGNVTKVMKIATDVTGRVQAMNNVGRSLTDLAAGNLDCKLSEKFPKDMEQLRLDLNTTIEHFSETFEKIRGTTSSVNVGVREIVTASDDLSLRTEKQAAALEETAATLDSVTETIQKSAEGAQSTQNVVEAAKNDANDSSEVMSKALLAMQEIEASAKEINQIISVIDEIAFQTNLLALNAGVEAARAGEAGQGFAVVASEVRALAQRSAEAAKEIKSLISKSSEQVTSGSKLVGETSEKLNKISSQVLEISNVVSEIAEGTTQQFSSLNELNQTVKELDVATQQNAAMAEESTAACHSLSKESDELATLLARFGGSGQQPQLVDSAATYSTHQTASPATNLVDKVRGAFSGSVDGNTALDNDDWQEF